MPDNNEILHAAFWSGLHQEVAAIDRQSVYIKVLAVALFLAGSLTALTYEIVLMISLLWFAETHLKVYQTRAIKQLVTLEKSAHSNVYLHYDSVSLGVLGLSQEYAEAAFKPTVIAYYLLTIFWFVILI